MLAVKIDHYLPTKIFGEQCENLPTFVYTSGSVIAEHLINDQISALSFTKEYFTVLIKTHSDYHLKALEALYIKSISLPSISRRNGC